MKLFDAVGEEILPGCSVVYPVYTKGVLSMRRMRVVEAAGGRIVGYRSDGRRVTVRQVHNCVVVNVKEVDSEEFYEWGIG